MKKNLKFLAIVPMVLFLVTGCGNKTTTDAHELYKVFHNVVMADKLNLKALQKNTRSSIDDYFIKDLSDIEKYEDVNRNEIIDNYINDELGDSLMTNFLKVNLINTFSFMDFLSDGTMTDLDKLESNLEKLKNQLVITKDKNGRLTAKTKEVNKILELETSYWFNDVDDENITVETEYLGTVRETEPRELSTGNGYTNVFYYDMIRIKKTTDAGIEDEEIEYFTEQINYTFTVETEGEVGKISYISVSKLTTPREVSKEKYDGYWDEKVASFMKKNDEDTTVEIYIEN